MIRHKPLGWILRGHSALQGVSGKRNGLLVRHTGSRIADPRPFGDAQLSLDDIDAGDLLGDRMFDLKARIDLNKIERVCVSVH